MGKISYTTNIISNVGVVHLVHCAKHHYIKTPLISFMIITLAEIFIMFQTHTSQHCKNKDNTHTKEAVYKIHIVINICNSKTPKIYNFMTCEVIINLELNVHRHNSLMCICLDYEIIFLNFSYLCEQKFTILALSQTKSYVIYLYTHVYNLVV